MVKARILDYSAMIGNQSNLLTITFYKKGSLSNQLNMQNQVIN